MNILIANNHNYIRGGAEKVYFDEIELLRNDGNLVIPYSYNDDNSIKHNKKYNEMLNDFDTNNFQKLKNIFWNKEANKHIKKLIKKYDISIFHGHNIHTRLSPSIIFAAKDLGLKTFVTLHDLKYVCPHYSMLHNNSICEECKGGKYYHAVINKCHKNSYIKSAIVAAELYNFSRLNLENVVDTFISPSLFLKNKYIEMGFKGHITYIPNFIDIDQYKVKNLPLTNKFLFVGRLSYEKGIRVLLEAFKDNNFYLDIVGNGPLMDELKEYVEKNNFMQRIHFYGHLSTEKVLEKVEECKALILPSQTYENAPISILEAMSFGKIVLGSNLGGIPEMIKDGKNGFLFKPGLSSDINLAINKLESLSEKDKKRYSNYSLELIRTIYSKENHLNLLKKLYNGNKS